MAQNHINKQKEGNKPNKPSSGPKPRDNDSGLSAFECPVCMDIMSPPIYLCESGHSICSGCTAKLLPPNCPLCQALIKQTRNFSLEAMIEKVRIPCPNKSIGCKYNMMQGELAKHVEECIFRTSDCIFGTIFGKCSWSGPLQTMLAHCKERHGENTGKIKVDTDIVVKNFKSDVDERILELVEVGTHLCYYHFKVDTLTGNAYWAVQLVGTADYVKNWIYEVHIFNKSEPERKVKFVDMCKPDNTSVKSILENNQCAILPLASLKTFVDNKKNLVVKIFIKRCDNVKTKNKGNPNNPNGNSDNSNPNGNSNNSNPNKNNSNPNTKNNPGNNPKPKNKKKQQAE